MSGGGGGGGGDWRPTSTIGSTAGTPTGGATGAGGGGGASGPNPCMFTEITNLSSPNAAVVSNVTVGSVLAISLQQTPLRVVAMSGGALAGSITSARLADIIQCLRAGQQYEARVTAINGGQITLEIYPI